MHLPNPPDHVTRFMRHRQIGAEIKQLMLNPKQLPLELYVLAIGDRNAQKTVQFVNRATGNDANIDLGDALATK
jgi:hypothetical protein